jgi:hypothetical protein
LDEGTGQQFKIQLLDSTEPNRMVMAKLKDIFNLNGRSRPQEV